MEDIKAEAYQHVQLALITFGNVSFSLRDSTWSSQTFSFLIAIQRRRTPQNICTKANFTPASLLGQMFYLIARHMRDEKIDKYSEGSISGNR